jgi:hypothetical protein
MNHALQARRQLAQWRWSAARQGREEVAGGLGHGRSILFCSLPQHDLRRACAQSA